MTKLALDKTLTAAVVAIVLGTLAGVLTAETQPGAALAGAVWVPPVVAGITAIAALIRRQFSVPD